MNKKEFIKKLKHYLSQVKHHPHDTPSDEVVNIFLNNVIQKSGGGWDENIAVQEMRQAEWMLGVPSELERKASLIKEDDIHSILGSFFSARGCEYSQIPTSSSKTPDSFIASGNEKYICEVKSPKLRFDHEASPFGYKHKTVQRQILNPIHNAKKQFDDQDKDHEFPHILIFTSAHFQLCWKNFMDAINGGLANSNDGNLLVDLRKTEVYLSTKDLVRTIDGFIWFQVNDKKQFYQASYFLNKQSEHNSSTKKLFHHLYNQRISEMDNYFIID